MPEVNSKEAIARMVFLVFSFPCILWVSFYLIVAIILMYLGGLGKLDIFDMKRVINKARFPGAENGTGSITGSMGGTLVMVGFLAILYGKWQGLILFQSQLKGIGSGKPVAH